MVTVFKKDITMKPQLKHFLLTSSLFLSVQAFSQNPTEIDKATLQSLASQYNVALSVLEDFVESYNFKCPQEISAAKLVGVLNSEAEDTELGVMIEADRLQWRDIYVEARSGISCLDAGIVSKGY
ncbi:MAG: hypothetical protein ACJA1U_001154 [Bermanella sp.]|jgi:hypothetical protein